MHQARVNYPQLPEAAAAFGTSSRQSGLPKVAGTVLCTLTKPQASRLTHGHRQGPKRRRYAVDLHRVSADQSICLQVARPCSIPEKPHGRTRVKDPAYRTVRCSSYKYTGSDCAESSPGLRPGCWCSSIFDVLGYRNFSAWQDRRWGFTGKERCKSHGLESAFELSQGHVGSRRPMSSNTSECKCSTVSADSTHSLCSSRRKG